MKRFIIGILLALLAGFGLGLVYSWLISPVRVFDSEPVALRADFKDQYRSAIAAAYAANNNLPRAQVRLALLGDPDVIAALNAQAQRTIAGGGTFQQADQLAALAVALENGRSPLAIASPIAQNTEPVIITFTETPSSPSLDFSLQFTETPRSVETRSFQPLPLTSTQRPTQTSTPTPGAPFALISQDALCDPSLPDGILQVMVFNSSRRQLAGVRIIVTWDGGEEQFFTGFKPELGNGYADYVMSPSVTYTLQLAFGSDIATGLIAPACQMPGGGSYWGGIKLTFQQP